MAAKKQQGGHSLLHSDCEIGEIGRDLFEACKNGDLVKVRRVVNSNSNVNLRDTAGRKSSPLHFAAGKRFFIQLLYSFCYDVSVCRLCNLAL